MKPWDRVKLVAIEWLLQRDAEARAVERERDPARARLVEKCLSAADERLELLGDVSEPEVALSASATLRETTRLLLEAASSGGGATDTTAELNRICDEIAVPAATRAAGLRLLAIDDPLALESMPRDELVASAGALEQIARGLRAHVDGRSAASIARSRQRRVAFAVFAVLYGLYALGMQLFGPKNVARGKPVLLSSVETGSAPPEMLVDGVRSGDTKPGDPKPDIVLTRHGSPPWALIDLGREYKIRQVRIYNRDDGSFDDGLPYIVDFSFDGHTFWEVGRCETHFGSWWIDPPCRVPCDHRITRYVRVRATNYLALSEIEVYP